jgi:hypothetical protein
MLMQEGPHAPEIDYIVIIKNILEYIAAGGAS